MGDVDVLDMLFDSTTGILGNQTGVNVLTKQNSIGMDLPNDLDMDILFTNPADSKVSTGINEHGVDVLSHNQAVFDSQSDWSTSFLTSSLDGLDHNEFFNALMESNLPDDVKQQQQQHQQLTQPQQFTDHAYSITPSSPHSDSGVSSGPYSPSNSSSGAEDLPFDIERELFGPLDLKTYERADDEDISAVDPMLLDSFSDGSSSPGLFGNESPVNFDFEEFTAHSAAKSPVKGLTISTDETTKVIKVLSINGTHSTSLLSSKQKAVSSSNSPYPELTLSDEEKDLLRKEGISLPSHLPLTREEEKILRSVRRRIRNKASARNSRRKKQDYMEALEKRVKLCTDEKRQLQKKVNDLEKHNSSLMGQLKRLHKLVTEGTRQTAKTGTCAMILALSFALVLLPNYQSLMGSNDSSQDTLMKPPCDSNGRPSRSLLSKSEDYTMPASQDKSFNYIPFLNVNKMVSLVSPARHPVADPVDGDKKYVHDSIDETDVIGQNSVSSFISGDEKVIHMEITKLPESVSAAEGQAVNHSAGDPSIQQEHIVRRRAIRMDLDDEL